MPKLPLPVSIQFTGQLRSPAGCVSQSVGKVVVGNPLAGKGDAVPVHDHDDDDDDDGGGVGLQQGAEGGGLQLGGGGRGLQRTYLQSASAPPHGLARIGGGRHPHWNENVKF